MTTRQNILTYRVLDRTVTAEELRELAELASDNESIWSHLADSLTAERTITTGVQAAGDIAAAIELPSVAVAVPESHRSLRWQVAANWAGWAAAALLAIVLIIVRSSQTTPPPDSSTMLVANQPSLDELLQSYIRDGNDQGRVLGQLPSLTVDVQPTADGLATEVTYVRRFLERTTIDQLYRLGRDEHGRPTAIQDTRTTPAMARSM